MMQQPRRQQQLTADLWAKAGELEKQFASYKKKIEVRSDRDRGKDDDHQPSRQRGEFYNKYMRIRDVRLREQSSRLSVDGRQAEMAAMWEQLDKRQVEMAVRFGSAGGGKVGPVQMTPETASTPPPKKTVQLKKESPDEKRGRDVTPRSTSSTRRHGIFSQSSTPTSSQSTVTRASTLPQSPKRTPSIGSSNGARSVQRLSSPARSAAIFSDLRKESKTPVTPKTRVLTKSQSLVLEKNINSARGSQKMPPQHVNVSRRGNETIDMFESKDHDQTTVEENSRKSGNDAIFEPVITIEDDILPKLQESLTEAVLNQKIEEELLNMRSSSSNEILDYLEPNNGSNDKNDERNNLEPDNADDSYDTVTVSNVTSILNPAIDDDDGESSGGSSRSWCSNVETSFSRSTIDPMIDSPILSPRGSGSTSFRFLPEPSTVRVRKKWESRSINSPRGIKRFLSFGKKNKVSEILANDMMSASAGLSSIITDDDEGDSFSNVINKMSSVSYESNGSRNEIESENGDRPSVGTQQAPALTGSLAASVLKYDQREDINLSNDCSLDALTVNSQKSHRSFFAFRPFLFKGAESKIRS